MIRTDEVYKTVLLILNKEQRGYMTPAEFNKVANQVQLEIFEKYFEDLNQQLRSPQNDSEYGDRVKNIREKIQIFETSQTLTPSTNGFTPANPSDVHRVGTLECAVQNLSPIEIEMVNRKQFTEITRSKLTTPSLQNPIYYQFNNEFIISPSTVSSANSIITLFYVRKPKPPTWDYTIGTLGEYVYTGGQDFELSSIEQSEVVLKILMYAGVIIRDPQIIQTATQMAVAEDANEKT